jgi:hypothetical protein
MNPTAAPYPVYGYKLAATGSLGPIPQTATVSTTSPNNLFCQYSPTPSVSSNPSALSTSGIVWAIETGNSFNPVQNNCNGTTTAVALHAFNATTLASLYNSRSVTTMIGKATSFSTPTVFQGRVYIGTGTTTVNGGTAPGLAVFGLCSSQGSGCQQ